MDRGIDPLYPDGQKRRLGRRTTSSYVALITPVKAAADVDLSHLRWRARGDRDGYTVSGTPNFVSLSRDSSLPLRGSVLEGKSLGKAPLFPLSVATDAATYLNGVLVTPERIFPYASPQSGNDVMRGF